MLTVPDLPRKPKQLLIWDILLVLDLETFYVTRSRTMPAYPGPTWRHGVAFNGIRALMDPKPVLYSASLNSKRTRERPSNMRLFFDSARYRHSRSVTGRVDRPLVLPVLKVLQGQRSRCSVGKRTTRSLTSPTRAHHRQQRSVYRGTIDGKVGLPCRQSRRRCPLIAPSHKRGLIAAKPSTCGPFSWFGT
jgi:hypothetical protein